MATTNIAYTNSIISPTGGVNAIAGEGETYEFVLSQLGTAGQVTILLTDETSGLQTQVGFADVTGVVPTKVFAFNNKVYALADTYVYMSEINDDTSWNNINGEGNGFVQLLNWYSSPEALIASAPFQGRLAFLTRRTVQIWQTDPDIANWQIMQTLPNIGTFAKASVQSLGDLDVIFLSDSGLRSLRSRETTLNAMVTDLGSAVDTFVQATLLTLNETQRAASCGIVDPSQNRYWCFIQNTAGTSGVIYVLSYYPMNKIVAWSQYATTDDSGSDFIPFKFCTYNGQVYAFANGAFYLYGGSDNNTYDVSVATLQIPFYDEKKPGHMKQAKAIDVDVVGTWNVYTTPDWITNPETLVANVTQATFDQGWVGYSDTGTHFSSTLKSTGSGEAKVSSILFYYELAQEP